jgi:hypothetical protein
VDTLEFFPQHVKIPHLSTSEFAIQAAHELMVSLRNPVHDAPFAHSGHDQHESLDRPAKFFKKIADPEPTEEEAQRPAEAPIVMPARPPAVPNIAQSPAPESAPSVVPSLVTIARPTSIPSRTPYTRDAAPSPRVGTPPTRVNQPPETPNTHRRPSPTIRTPKTHPVFDLYQQRRQTMIP